MDLNIKLEYLLISLNFDVFSKQLVSELRQLDLMFLANNWYQSLNSNYDLVMT